jgi:hypothetical protein
LADQHSLGGRFVGGFIQVRFSVLIWNCRCHNTVSICIMIINDYNI